MQLRPPHCTYTHTHTHLRDLSVSGETYVAGGGDGGGGGGSDDGGTCKVRLRLV